MLISRANITRDIIKVCAIPGCKRYAGNGKIMVATRKTGYAWTLNNYTPEEVLELQEIAMESRVQYMCFGYEVGEEGTPHLQGMIIFKNPMTTENARRQMPTRVAHFKWFTKPPFANFKYCTGDTKDKTPNEFWEHGKRPKKAGARTDIEHLYDQAKKNVPVTEIGESNPEGYLRYHKGIEQVRLNYARTRKRVESIEVILVEGTQEKLYNWMCDNHGDDWYHYNRDDGNFEEYRGEKVIFWDTGYYPNDKYLTTQNFPLNRKFGSTIKEWEKIYFLGSWQDFTVPRARITKDMQLE